MRQRHRCLAKGLHQGTGAGVGGAAITRLRKRLGAVPAPIVGVLKAIETHVARRPYLRGINAAQGRNVRLVNAEEVCYLKADNKYTLLVTADNESLISKPIEQLLDELRPKVSRPIHCGVVVNVNAIALAPRRFSGQLQIHLKARKETLAINEPFGYRFKQVQPASGSLRRASNPAPTRPAPAAQNRPLGAIPRLEANKMTSKWMTLLAAGCAAWVLGAEPARAQSAPELANTESSAPAPATALSGAALRVALQQGGYVVYFRHAATDYSRNDAGMTSYEDCAHQRLLSAQGQQDARDIGRAIRSLRLPVGERLASPFCRTLDHARLMLGEATARVDVREGQGNDYAGLKRLLAEPVAPGSNRWIVGHGTPFRAVAGPPHLAEGEAVVIRPGSSGWTVVGRLDVKDWSALASAR